MDKIIVSDCDCCRFIDYDIPICKDVKCKLNLEMYTEICSKYKSYLDEEGPQE